MLRGSPLDLVIPICIRVQKGCDGIKGCVPTLSYGYINDMLGALAMCAEDLDVETASTRRTQGFHVRQKGDFRFTLPNEKQGFDSAAPVQGSSAHGDQGLGTAPNAPAMYLA